MAASCATTTFGNDDPLVRVLGSRVYSTTEASPGLKQKIETDVAVRPPSKWPLIQPHTVCKPSVKYIVQRGRARVGK